jgi:hypothetical protein
VTEGAKHLRDNDLRFGARADVATQNLLAIACLQWFPWEATLIDKGEIPYPLRFGKSAIRTCINVANPKDRPFESQCPDFRHLSRAVQRLDSNSPFVCFQIRFLGTP